MYHQIRTVYIKQPKYYQNTKKWVEVVDESMRSHNLGLCIKLGLCFI